MPVCVCVCVLIVLYLILQLENNNAMCFICRVVKTNVINFCYRE